VPSRPVWLTAVLLTSAAVSAPAEIASAPFIELRNGLGNTATVFQQGQGRVAFLGGSITQMTGWRDLVCEDLKTRFPETEFDFVQAGVASMGSTPNAFRLARDVFSRGGVNLLFVEAAVNDATNGRTPVEQIRGMEGIVRHARRLNPKIDIVFLYFVDPDKIASYNRGETPEVIQNHARVAEHYGIPSIDLAEEVTERIAAGEFTWDNDFKDLHPSPFGHEVYRRSIARLLDMAWHDPSSSLQAHEIPGKLDEFAYDNGHVASIDTAHALDGFLIDPNWNPSDGAGTRPGFTNVPMLISESPGGSFEVQFEGTAVGLWVAAGPDAGIVECTIDGGPVKRIDMYTQWSRALHLPWAYIVDAELSAGDHVLRVTNVKPDASRAEGGTSVRIAHFLVNAPSE
jgi:sialidase-1